MGFRVGSETGKEKRRSLHYATPDFPFKLVALMELVRLSFRRAASVVVASYAR